jgi:hypothetical protein
LRNVVKEKFPVLIQHAGQADKSLAALSMLLQHLQLLKSSTLDSRSLQLYLHNLRERISPVTAQGMLKRINKGGDDGDRSNTLSEKIDSSVTGDSDVMHASKVARIEE